MREKRFWFIIVIVARELFIRGEKDDYNANDLKSKSKSKPKKKEVKIFFAVLAAFILMYFISTRPSVRYFSVVRDMKNISSGKYIAKIIIDEPRAFLKWNPDQGTDFEVYLKAGDYTEEEVNQIGEELKAVIDNNLSNKNLWEKLRNDSYKIVLTITPRPYHNRANREGVWSRRLYFSEDSSKYSNW